MDAMMDLRTLRGEINKLSEIVEGWNTSESIPEIERDIVLEKLRALYDAVRFADRVPDTKGADCVDSFQGRTPMLESPIPHPIPALLQDPEPEYVPEPAAIAISEMEAVPESEPEYTPEQEPELEPISESELVPELETAPETATELEVAPESVSEPEQVLVAYRTSSQESDADQLPIGYRSPKPTKRAEPDTEILVPVAAPTLFGLDSDESEAEKLRHRHKQRVILSLYGTNPESPAVEPIRQAFAQDNHPSASTHQEQEPVTFAAEPVRESPDPVVETAIQTPAKLEEEKLTEEEDDSIFEEISLTPNAVLGDVMKHDVQTLADTFAPRHDGTADLKHAEPITDLRQAIGLNDKFLLIRDLFGGDGAACDEALEILNGFEDLDDCMIHIAENYDWNPNSDGAKFIMEIIERKFA